MHYAHHRRPVQAVSICVPVKNEAARLPRFLEACARLQPVQLPITLSFTLDGCTDASLSILKAAQASGYRHHIHITEIPAHPVPHVGRVRRAGIADVLRLVPQKPVLLMMTDADSCPAPDWVCEAVRLSRDWDMMCGFVDRIQGDRDRIQHAFEHYLADLHRLRRRIDPRPGDAEFEHCYEYGANLAIHSDAYLAIGGMPDLPLDEDTQLVREARLQGFQVISDSRLRVATSLRRTGRASGGFSDALQIFDRLAAEGRWPTVQCPHSSARVFEAEARTRRAFSESLSYHAAATGCDLDRLQRDRARSATADAFVARRHERFRPDGDVPLDMAHDRLRAMLSKAIVHA